MATSVIKKSMSYTSGTDGIWKYRKYDDGTYHAWYEGTINLLSGTAWGSGFFYHKSSSTLNPPSFSQSVTSLTGATTGGTLAIWSGVGDGYIQYWTTSSSAAGMIGARLDMYGTW